MIATTPVRNAVHVIHAYRHPRSKAVWVFDDARFGLREEPFVLGASEAIDRVVAEKFGQADAVTLIFSEHPMPKCDRVLRKLWVGDAVPTAGCAYHDGTDELWLCPAMAHYFGGGIAPEHIYLTAQAA